MTLQLSRRAVRQLQRLTPTVRRRVGEAIDGLRSGRSGDVRPLVGQSNLYRLRVGDYRVVFSRRDTIITIEQVTHRRDAYRDL